jgi:hypothetical protein
MFIGHFGAGFAAKAIDNKPSLGTLFLAAQFIDLLWPLFLVLGIEHVNVGTSSSPFETLNFTYYPFSHSLFSVIIWAILFGAVYYLIRKNIKSALILGLLVISHWVLDLIVHIPDLPLSPWSNYKVGFGVWNSVPATIIVECAFFAAGIFLYSRTTKALNKKGSIGLWSLIIFLIIMYFLSLSSTPPADEKVIGISGFSQWIIIFWGYWINKNRINTAN